MTRSLLALAGLLLLPACATLDENQCRRADWHALGQQDGSAGYARERLAEHDEACREYAIRPDAGAYLAGREMGLRQYCQPANAVREGLAGRNYRGVCPAASHAMFGELHRAAYDVHAARSRVDGLHRKSERLERELRDDKTGREQRARIRDELRDTDRQLSRARDELRWKESDLDRVSARWLR
ncbi:MAG: DUF2799 domain-containing protein [Rhodocyclaceae bacterium]|nr:DUF2799 domain-containing protein [Rhodocyclaceae bacterium]